MIQIIAVRETVREIGELGQHRTQSRGYLIVNINVSTKAIAKTEDPIACMYEYKKSILSFQRSLPDLDNRNIK